MKRWAFKGIYQYVKLCDFGIDLGVILMVYLKICKMSTNTGISQNRTKERMGQNMKNMSEHGNVAKSGLQTFKRLEALQILPLPICLRNGKAVDVEHATSQEFSAWLRLNKVPFRFTGPEEWNFDRKCGVINHALKFGLRLQLIADPGDVFGMSSGCLQDVFEWPKPALEAE